MIALFVGASTCLCMYYDSNDPGSFPPTPVSPSPKRGRSVCDCCIIMNRPPVCTGFCLLNDTEETCFQSHCIIMITIVMSYFDMYELQFLFCRSRVVARSRWHLGYIFAFVNFVVAFLCLVYCLRWRLGLPIFAYYSSSS